jgi:hypothetical protein
MSQEHESKTPLQDNHLGSDPADDAMIARDTRYAGSKTPRSDFYEMTLRSNGESIKVVFSDIVRRIESELSTLREELQRVKGEAADFHVVITRDLASARKERDHALLRITKLESQLKASEKDATQAHHAHAVTIDQLAAREEELRQAREERDKWRVEALVPDQDGDPTGQTWHSYCRNIERIAKKWLEEKETAEAALVEAQEIGARKDDALIIARDKFFSYSTLHFAKYTVEGNEKGRSNFALYEQMKDALALTQTPNLYRELTERIRELETKAGIPRFSGEIGARLCCECHSILIGTEIQAGICAGCAEGAAPEDYAFRARIAHLEKELLEAAITFRSYEAMHMAKGTDEGARKAEINAAHAQRIESAIGRKGGE